jgi:hypothetical protein
MSLRLSTGTVNKLMDTSPFKTLFAGGFIDIYSGTRPTAADDAPPSGAIKLATVYSNGTSNGLTFETNATGGVLTKNPAETWSCSSIFADGTAYWFRLREASDPGTASSTTACRVDGTVGTSGADMNLTSTSFAAGAPLTISAAQFTLPSA